MDESDPYRPDETALDCIRKSGRLLIQLAPCGEAATDPLIATQRMSGWRERFGTPHHALCASTQAALLVPPGLRSIAKVFPDELCSESRLAERVLERFRWLTDQLRDESHPVFTLIIAEYTWLTVLVDWLTSPHALLDFVATSPRAYDLFELTDERRFRPVTT